MKQKKTPRKSEVSTSQSTANSMKCCYCAAPLHPRTSCPAQREKCHFCQKLGHFEKACRIEKRDGKKLDVIAAPDNEHLLGTLEQSKNTLSALFVTVQINGQELRMGAEVTLVSYNFQGVPRSLDEAESLRGPSDATISTVGKFHANVTWKDNCSRQTIYVVRNLRTPLLGFPAVNALGIVRFLDEIESVKDVEAKYPKLFKGTGSA